MKFTEVRQRRKKTISAESQPNQSNFAQLQGNAEEKWKVSHFDKLLEVIIKSTGVRFEFMKNNLQNFRILYDSKFRQTVTSELLLSNCKDLQHLLTENENSDIAGLQLHQELLLFKDSFSSKYEKNPVEILQLIRDMQMEEAFPNFCIILRIFLTIPVSVASCERSFSKLKLIKTYLRYTMSQDRLTGLATLSIEKDLAARIQFQDTIEIFANSKCRKAEF